jgi:hypothetical protein
MVNAMQPLLPAISAVLVAFGAGDPRRVVVLPTLHSSFD